MCTEGCGTTQCAKSQIDNSTQADDPVGSTAKLAQLPSSVAEFSYCVYFS